MSTKIIAEQNSRKVQYKYVNLLMAVYVTSLLLVVLLANSLVVVGNMLETGGIFVFPATFLICDIVSEVYGYWLARQFIWIGIICEFLFAGIATLVIHLPHPDTWQYSEHYMTVISPTIRYVFSSLIALLVGEFINTYLLVTWKIKLHGRLFWLRSILAAACGQAALSIIAITFMLAGILSWDKLAWIMWCGFSWKMMTTIIMIYPVWLLVKIIKKKEGINITDVGTNLNPFKINE